MAMAVQVAHDGFLQILLHVFPPTEILHVPVNDPSGAGNTAAGARPSLSRAFKTGTIPSVFAIKGTKATQGPQESAGGTPALRASSASNGITLSRVKRAILIVIGTSSLAVGIVGIFMPILPTTPFLLLAAACYVRSSKRFYNWLIGNRFFGEYVRNYLERKGVPLRVKVSSLALLWITIGCSAAFATDTLWVRIILVVIATGVTAHILSLRTLRG